jgi:hypothetical protein
MQSPEGVVEEEAKTLHLSDIYSEVGKLYEG